MHLMIDFETLSTEPGAEILSAGLVVFDVLSPNSGILQRHGYQLAPNGGDISRSTVDWWMSQSPEAQEATFGGDECLHGNLLIDDIRSLMVEHSIGNVWANGPTADLVWLRNLCKRLGKPNPVVYWQERCMRTIRMLAESMGSHKQAVEYADKRTEGPKHSAIVDATWQAHYIIFVHQIIFGR